MAQTDVKVRLSLDDKLSKNLKGVGNSVGGLSKSFGLLKVAIAGVVGGAVAKQLYDFTDMAGRFQGISKGFDLMAKDFGIASDDIIKSVKKATAGTVSELDILTNANLGMALIGKESFTDFSEQFSQMSAIAIKSAMATGQDVGYMFDSIVRGVGRTSPLILDNLGLSVKLGEVYDNFAQSLNKTSEELTSAEQKQALLNEVLRQGAEKYGDLQLSEDSYAVAQGRFKAQLDDLKKTLGEQFLPALTSVLQKINELIPSGDQLQSIFAVVSEKVNWLKQKFQEFWNFISPYVLPLVDMVRQSLVELAEELNLNSDQMRVLTNIAKGVAIVVGGALYIAFVSIVAIVKVSIDIIKTIIKVFKMFLDGINALNDKLWGFINAMKDLYEWGKKILSLSWDKLKEVFGFKDKEGGSDKKRATGGLVTPASTYLVGERGAELFKPTGTGKIIPANQLQGVGGGGVPVTLNVNVGVYAGTEAEKRNIAESLYKSLVQLAGMQNKTVAQLLGA